LVVLADSLRVLFEEIITFDASGSISYNIQRAVELLGVDKARELERQFVDFETRDEAAVGCFFGW